MRKVLILALLIAATLPFVGSRPAAGCNDWDQDGVCAGVDCNDNNPTLGYDGDADADGVTICQGDCDDLDATNIDSCGHVHQQYPIYMYDPPSGGCSEGFTVTTSYYHCSIINGYRSCLSFPYYVVDNTYLRNC